MAPRIAARSLLGKGQFWTPIGGQLSTPFDMEAQTLAEEIRIFEDSQLSAFPRAGRPSSAPHHVRSLQAGRRARRGEGDGAGLGMRRPSLGRDAPMRSLSLARVGGGEGWPQHSGARGCSPSIIWTSPS